MRFSILAAACFAALTSSPALGDEDLREFGEATCFAAIYNGIEGIDGDHYIETADANGIDHIEYCGCVGRAFVENAEAQGQIMATFEDTEDEATAMLRVIIGNMNHCLPDEASDEAIGLDPFDPDYDLSEDIPEDEIEVFDGEPLEPDYDYHDAMTCVEVIAGDFPARGFDAEAIRAYMARKGLEVSQICTCTAIWMVDQGDELQDAIANSSAPGTEWGTALGRGIEACVAEF